MAIQQRLRRPGAEAGHRDIDLLSVMLVPAAEVLNDVLVRYSSLFLHQIHCIRRRHPQCCLAPPAIEIAAGSGRFPL